MRNVLNICKTDNQSGYPFECNKNQSGASVFKSNFLSMAFSSEFLSKMSPSSTTVIDSVSREKHSLQLLYPLHINCSPLGKKAKWIIVITIYLMGGHRFTSLKLESHPSSSPGHKQIQHAALGHGVAFYYLPIEIRNFCIEFLFHLRKKRWNYSVFVKSLFSSLIFREKNDTMTLS